MSEAVPVTDDEHRSVLVVSTGIRLKSAWLSTICSVPWEYIVAFLVIVVVVSSTVLTIGPIFPLLTEEGENLRQAPKFYVSYTWQYSGETRVAPTTTPANNTTQSTTTPTNTSNQSSNTTPSTTLPPDSAQSDLSVVTTTVYYLCESVSKYARTEYRDYRCVFYANETNVVSNKSRATNVTNETRFEIVWQPTEGQSEPSPQEVNLSAENGEILPRKREISIDSPPENGNYTLQVTADEGAVELARPTLGEPKERILISMYDPERVANFREREFNRRTLPFQLLAIIVLWFGGIQLVLSLFNYRRNRRSRDDPTND